MTITVSALTATPALAGVALQCTVTDTLGDKGPSYLRLDQVEFHAATTNNRALAAKVAEGKTSGFHMAQQDGTANYYWCRARYQGDGTVFSDWYPSSATGGVAATAGFTGTDEGLASTAIGLGKGKITVTHNSPSSNQLTVAIKTADGNDPSTTQPVFVAFPNTDGTFTSRKITAALSLTLSAGSTLATTNGTPFRLWFAIFDDAGTLRLAARNSSSAGTVYSLSGTGIASSTAEGGAGAADNVATFYTGTAVSNKAYRLVGYADWESGLATAGNWSAAPTTINIHSLGGPKPGDFVQDITFPLTSVVTGTTTVPYDDSIPQSSGESTSMTTASILPRSLVNALEIEFLGNLSCTVAGPIMVSVDKADANVLAVGWGDIRAADALTQVRLLHRRQFATASSVLIDFRMAPTNAGTITLNGVNGSRKFGGALTSFARLKEIVG